MDYNINWRTPAAAAPAAAAPAAAAAATTIPSTCSSLHTTHYVLIAHAANATCCIERNRAGSAVDLTIHTPLTTYYTPLTHAEVYQPGL